MAQLVEIKLVLNIEDLTSEQAERFGHIADEVASQAAEDIYGGGVTIKVVLEDGSLFTKVTVIGGLMLGTYHGVAAYPDFKDGIIELCEDANKYSNEFVTHFLSATGTPQEDVLKVTTSTKTPGKIKRLLNKLENLDANGDRTKKAEFEKKLGSAKRTLDSLTRDITDAEIDHIKTQLEFSHLPPIKKWPSQAPTRSKKSETKIGRSAPVKRRPRLLYSNTITVPKKRQPR